jgi:hypothetical protein
MSKFVVIYHADADAVAATQNMDPEEMQKGMNAWFEWGNGIGDALVDFGTPLMGGIKVTPSGTSPSDKEVTGYSILEAESMDAVAEMLKGHPHLGWAAGCEIEVHETMAVPGM